MQPNALPPGGCAVHAPETEREEPNWVIEVDEGRGYLLGPYYQQMTDLCSSRRIISVGIHRSDSHEAYLLMGDGRYALGIPEVGSKELQAALSWRIS